MERGRNRRKRSREETYRKRAIEKGISIWLYKRKVEYTKQNGAEMPKNGENNSAEIGVNSGIVPICLNQINTKKKQNKKEELLIRIQTTKNG